MSKKFQLTAPWVTYYRKVQALFSPDPDISIIFDEDKGFINLYVNDGDKAKAIEQLLPYERTWGQTVIGINVIVPNALRVSGNFFNAKLFEVAFKGNPAFVGAKTLSYEDFSNPMTFVEFAPEVVQYYDDNIGSLTGLSSCLYEQIARELFESLDGVFFSTHRK